MLLNYVFRDALKRILFPLTIVLILVCVPALGQRTIHMNMEKLVQNAGMIIHGTVLKTETGFDSVSHLVVTWVTIRVQENFYGAPADEFTFKQYGGRHGKRVVKLPDMPQYRAGEEVILMLTSPSRIGMQSPVGMQQGKFRIREDETSGQKIAINGLNNRRVFDGVKSTDVNMKLKKTTAKSDAIAVDDFSSIVRSLVKSVKMTEAR